MVGVSSSIFNRNPLKRQILIVDCRTDPFMTISLVLSISAKLLDSPRPAARREDLNVVEPIEPSGGGQ
jgi:hypothetical protein